MLFLKQIYQWIYHIYYHIYHITSIPSLQGLYARIRSGSFQGILQHQELRSLLFAISVWVLKLPPSNQQLEEDAGHRANGFSSLSEKTRMPNRLQISWQRQHILLSYFKTLSVGPVWVLNPDLLHSSSALIHVS